jgi:ribonucleotide reductase beta subunit family protein with ferritin-like domain
VSIFQENVAYRPFVYPWAVEAEKRHRIDMHWHENQVELQDDLRQFTTKGGMATPNVSHESNKNMLEKLLLLFTEMDVQVGTGYAKLLGHVKNNEIRTLWMTFAQREVAHQRGYALAAETFGYTNSDWSEFKQYKEMMDKIDIITQDVGDLSNKLNFAKALSVLFLGEGISLFGAFACLLNLKRFGVAQNFNTINEWSLKDEHDHVMRNIQIWKTIKDEDLSEQENYELDQFVQCAVEQYIQAEHKFLDLVFEMGDQEQMSLQEAKDFIVYLGKLRLFQAGIIERDQVPKNPLPWIDYLLTGSTHTNFFESRVVDYSHNKLSGEINYEIYKSKLADRMV